MSESEIPPYPPIEPTSFDLIVIGTGLPESLITAAASHAGKSVLHLDPNPFYGSHYSSLSPSDLSSFLKQNSQVTPTQSLQSSPDFNIAYVSSHPIYSDVEISDYSSEILSDQIARKFILDVSGPRVLFCADKSIDQILKSGVNQYLEFKSIDASFVGDGNGSLSLVPDSRAAIFKDKSLRLAEKNLLMKFFKLVQQHLSCDEEAVRISDEDLELPFVNFLTKMNLPQKIKRIILYAIAMANYDQEKEDCEELLKTRDGMDRLALYNSSMGRFQNSLGAMIYPMYGQGELPQAFCRRAAVKGCIHVLRMPVVALLIDKDSGQYKGVRLSTGQEIFSDKLVVDSSFTVQFPLPSSPPHPLQEGLQRLALNDAKKKVARGICITSSSLKPDLANFLVVFPPRSLYPGQVKAIRVLQIGANLAVCPPDMFVLYLSTLCDDVGEGKKSLLAAINALLNVPTPDRPQTQSTENNENLKEEKPALLWSALYSQELTEFQFQFMGQVGTISSTPMPDGNLNYNGLFDATLKIFKKYYPDEDFFPETTSPENLENDDDVQNLDT